MCLCKKKQHYKVFVPPILYDTKLDYDHTNAAYIFLLRTLNAKPLKNTEMSLAP